MKKLYFSEEKAGLFCSIYGIGTVLDWIDIRLKISYGINTETYVMAG